MLIDDHLPEYDVTVTRHAVVEADPETTYRAALAADLLDTGPIVRALGWLRVAPTAVLERARRRESTATPDRLAFADVEEVDGWVRLDETPGEELVLGTVGKFWQPDIEWREVEPEAFADFDEPGYGKLALSLSVRPYGEGRTLCSYEARTATTDADSRRRFRRYWRLIGPFAGYLMTTALERIAADAEALARAGGKRTQPGSSRGNSPLADSSTPESSGERPSTSESSRANSSQVNSRSQRPAVSLTLVVGALAVAYHTLVRPWHRRWGATDAEVAKPLPGDDLEPDATDQVTHAVEIDAGPEDVWPWLVQLGQGRGGFYSYDWLERLVGADVHNVDWIVPEHQLLEEGDVVRLAPEAYPIQTPESAPVVERLEPGRALVLRPPVESPTWTWAFVLEPIDDGTTRLLVRQRSSPSSLLDRLLGSVFWEPAHFVMERKMLLGIKRRAEASREVSVVDEPERESTGPE